MGRQAQTVVRMTGYDKSPDYGGPPASWRSLVVIVACLVGYGLWTWLTR